MNQRWKKIGKIGKPHGLQGAFFVGGRSNLLPTGYRQVVVGPDPETGLATEIASYHLRKDRALLTLLACPDRNSLQAHIGQELWVKHSAGEDDLSALIGRQVLDSQGVLMGRVSEFYNHGASDNVEITAENGQVLEVPFVEAYFHWVFQPDEAPLQMKVLASHFAELWSPPAP